MHIRITKGRRDDLVAITREDGSTAETRVPHKGPLAHDSVHFWVERAFGLDRGFWGLLAEGRHPEELLEMAKAGGHASASRAGQPDASIVQLLQAERLVESYEALFWGGGGTFEQVREMAETGCATSLVPCPDFTADMHALLWADLSAFASDWIARSPGETVHLEWQ